MKAQIIIWLNCFTKNITFIENNKKLQYNVIELRKLHKFKHKGYYCNISIAFSGNKANTFYCTFCNFLTDMAKNSIGLQSKVPLKMFNYDNLNGDIKFKWVMEMKFAYFYFRFYATIKEGE